MQERDLEELTIAKVSLRIRSRKESPVKLTNALIAAPTIEDLERGFVEIDGKRTNLQDSRGNFLTLCTIPFNQTGLPALSLCCGFSSSGLPIGMQIIGKAYEEGAIFQVGSAYEKAAKWYERKPPLL